MILASIFFAVMNVIVRYLKPMGIPVEQIVFMRSIVMFVIVWFMLRRVGVNPWGIDKMRLVLRGLFGTLGISLFFYTLHAMPLASAVVVHYLTPIWTVLFAILFTQTKVRVLRFLFFGLCIVGVLMIKEFDSRVEALPLSLIHI